MLPVIAESPLVAVASAAVPGSRTAALDRAVAESLRRNGFRVRGIPLHRLPESALLAGRAGHPALARSAADVAASAAVVLITPCHQEPVSRLVRTWLDLVPLRGKPVRALCLGASRAQESGADYAVRRVLRRSGAGAVAPSRFLHERRLRATAAGWQLHPSAAALLDRDAAELRAAFAAPATGAQPRDRGTAAA